MSLYEKYHDDDTSRVKETEERLLSKVEDENVDFYIICDEKEPIEGIGISSS